jgi:hypothetical protein
VMFIITYCFVHKKWRKVTGLKIVFIHRLQSGSYYNKALIFFSEPVSSVSIVSDYGLDDLAIGSSIPSRGNGFFL